MKLNIQLFSSTNKTTNYELSQYIGTDKPTYLGDYNSDMGKIDAGMHTNATAILENSGNISANSTKIGTLSNLTTTNKDNLVGAINEVDDHADTNATNIGTLSNLTTENKTTLVNAINEVNSKTVEVLSQSEVKTNKVDVDGKDIYRTIIILGDGITTGNYQFTPINVYSLITLEGTGIRAGATNSYGINAMDYEDTTYSAFFRSELLNWSNIRVECSNHTYNKVRYVIEYTKPSA